MLLKRLIVCLDVRNRRVTKGVKFKDNVDVGDVIALADQYCRQGADELVFYDITASAEHRPIDLEMVTDAAKRVFIPFCVGGGIRSAVDMRNALLAGADKVSLNSLAVENPSILTSSANAFGSQCVVLGMDAKRVGVSGDFPSGYQVFIQGYRKPTQWDAVEWARYAVSLGAGEICLNAIDTDGVRNGYELEITRKVADAVSVPVIASGGAGCIQDFVTLFQTLPGVDAGLAASIFHFGEVRIDDLKDAMARAGIPARR